MVFGGAFLLWQGLLSAKYPRKNLPATLSLYILAGLLPYGLVCIWLWRAGAWEKFWFWTVEYASNYVRSIPLSLAGSQLRQTGGEIVRRNWPLGLLALVGIAGVAVLGRGKPVRTIFCVWICALFLLLCLSRLLLPRALFHRPAAPGGNVDRSWLPVVLGRGLWSVQNGSRFDFAHRCDHPGMPRTGPTFSRCAASGLTCSCNRRRTNPAGGRRTHRVPAAIAAGRNFAAWPALLAFVLLHPGVIIPGCVFYTLWLQREFFFIWDPQRACRMTYVSNPFVECPTIAEYLKKNTKADDTLAVLGSEPEIYFDAQRRSATGYIYTYGLMEDQPLALQMQEEMIAEIEAAKPKYVVFANIDCSWLATSSEQKIFRWSESYLDANYQLVGIVERRAESDAALSVGRPGADVSTAESTHRSGRILEVDAGFRRGQHAKVLAAAVYPRLAEEVIMPSRESIGRTALASSVALGAVWILLIVLHVRLLLNSGAFWRDESSSILLAQAPSWSIMWHHLAIDSFPGLFVALLEDLDPKRSGRKRFRHSLAGDLDFAGHARLGLLESVGPCRCGFRCWPYAWWG